MMFVLPWWRALIGLTPPDESIQSTPSQPPVSQSIPSAQTVILEGDVRLRRESAPNWISISKQQQIFDGDKIFVGAESRAVIRYGVLGSGDETTVSLKSNTIFEVNKAPPIASRLLKGFSLGDGKVSAVEGNFESQFLEPHFSSGLTGANDAENSSSSNDLIVQSSDGTMEMQFPIQNVSAIYPRKNILIPGSILPVKTSFLFENQEDLTGYLWKIDSKPKRPMWSGLGETIQPISGTKKIKAYDLVLREPGEFVFFATSRNGRMRSKPISIQVSPTQAPLLPPLLTSSSTLVIP